MNWPRVRSVRSLAGQCTACFVILVSAFLAAEALAVRVGDGSAVRERLVAAFATGVLTKETDPVSPYGHTGLKLDMFTECAALSTNLFNATLPLVVRLASTPYLRVPGTHPCPNLASAVMTAEPTTAQPNYRYWHGHQIYLKPLLRLFSLATIHKITAALLIGSVVFLSIMFARQYGRWAWLALVLPLVMLTDLLTLPVATVHALSLIWIFFSVALFCHLQRYLMRDHLIILVFASGVIGSFFDMIINPPMAPALLAFVALSRCARGRLHLKEQIAGAFAAFTFSGVWVIGFGLAYLARWVLAAIVLGPSVVVPNVVDQLLVRMSGEAIGVNAQALPFFTATTVQFEDVGTGGLAISCAIAVGIVGLSMWRVKSLGPLLLRFAFLCLPLIIPVLWVEVLRNHSIIHAGFVSRSFVLFATIPLLAALDLLGSSTACGANSDASAERAPPEGFH